MIVAKCFCFSLRELENLLAVFGHINAMSLEKIVVEKCDVFTPELLLGEDESVLVAYGRVKVGF